MSDVSLAAIQDFLAQKRIAVIGVSRNPKDFNTGLFRTLLACGYDAVPVNPQASEIEGVRCYASVQEISPRPDAALLMVPAEKTPMVANDCLEAKIPRVWMYRAAGQGAVNEAAVELCRRNGVTVIDGHCPYMFLPKTAVFHRLHGGILKLLRRYPK